MNVDEFAGLLLSLAFILVSAKLAAHVAVRLGQTSVVGELAVGMVLGNLGLVGLPSLGYLKTDTAIDLLSQLGVLLLLFQVGVEATVAQLLEVGWSSVFVATLGIAGPFGLGWGVGIWLLPDAGFHTHIFLAAMLTATSVGITARVLKDIGQSQSPEARIILGAAVLDDVMGLVVLAVVTGIIAASNDGRALSYVAVGIVVLKASVFLLGSLVLGVYFSPGLFSLASKLNASGVLLASGLAFCFVLAWLAHEIGLAPIVGAFAAGLVLENLHSRPFTTRGEHALDELLEPITSFLTPVFFVIMGVRTDLKVFGQPGVLGLSIALTAAAIIGKQLCALGVVGKGISRLSVGIGMIPRGEVGLIFANLGLTVLSAGQPVIDQRLFSAVVIMVIATTMVTPPALKWSFQRFRHA